MKLSDATILIGENSRYFSEVYKLFSFKDDQDLKDYLEFIAHEPVEWLKGFPAKLKTKNTFSRPKTVLIKLLKMNIVRSAVGEKIVDTVKNSVWLAYKKNIDAILEKRTKKHSANVIQQLVEPNEIITDADSVQSDIDYQESFEANVRNDPVPAPAVSSNHSESQCDSCKKLENKLNVSISVVYSLLRDYAYSAPGLANACTILINSLQID